MITDKILSKFKNITEWTLFLNERINDGHEISKGKLGGERSKFQKEKDLEKKRIDLKRRGYSEAKDEKKEKAKSHDRNTKTKEVHVKKSANGAETHKTIEKEPIPDQDMDQEQDQEQQMPPPPPPVQPQPGSQVKIGRKDANQKIDPAAIPIEVGKNTKEQKVDLKPKVIVKADTDYGVNKN